MYEFNHPLQTFKYLSCVTAFHGCRCCVFLVNLTMVHLQKQHFLRKIGKNPKSILPSSTILSTLASCITCTKWKRKMFKCSYCCILQRRVFLCPTSILFSLQTNIKQASMKSFYVILLGDLDR